MERRSAVGSERRDLAVDGAAGHVGEVAEFTIDDPGDGALDVAERHPRRGADVESAVARIVDRELGDLTDVTRRAVDGEISTF